MDDPPRFDGDNAHHGPAYSVHSPWTKRLIVLAASLSACFSPLTAQVYLPALNALAADFHVSSAQINLTVTTYMIFQAVTPMFVGGFADTAGRRPAYLLCFVVYIAANIGLGLSPSYGALMALRCLQAAGSSTTIALCQAVVADVATSAERGQYIGMTVIPVVLAPSLGPVMGGLLSQKLSWRCIFWLLAILAAVDLVLLLLFFPETCRRIVGDGSVRPPGLYRTCWQRIKDRTAGQGEGTPAPTFRLGRPDLLGSVGLLFQKEVGLLLGYSAITFSGFYAISTAMPSLLATHYGFDATVVGLMYLPLAGGSIVAAVAMGPLINWNWARHARARGLAGDAAAAAAAAAAADRARQPDLACFPVERARLEVGVPLLALAAAVLLCWGWALQSGAGVAVPCVLLFLMGVGMIGFNNCANALIIDLAPGRAAAAVAANNLTRCLLGAVASAVVVPMIDRIGAGWAYTVMGLLYLVFVPSVFLLMKNGMRWRAEVREKEAGRAAKGGETARSTDHDETDRAGHEPL
ncbi:hypothetical protein P8C59_005542 [Phyllachora maydis]|uniref:Major facilitator superfamily (MFS) profile domain-containing protein n=1 Tax=Phyllachora maydis TaxID=1825666 RepID=A0AAD9I4M2_9PEZI|nr:hypothetical protein P8C59_005542 [Phyllachora maydis]